jgi:hypothetical protein
MLQKWLSAISVLCWLVVWAFWLFLTYNFHPLFSLALIVTSSLVCTYAAAAYCNHLVLVPRFWGREKYWQYVSYLAAVMAIFTAIALAVIRVSYVTAFGPDPDPYGLYKHYAIDLFGMIVHVAAAALIVRATRLVVGIADRASVEAEHIKN